MAGIGLGLAFLAGMTLELTGVVLIGVAGTAAFVINRKPLVLPFIAVLLAALGMVRVADTGPNHVESLPSKDVVGEVASIPANTRTGQRFSVTVNDLDTQVPFKLCVSADGLEQVESGETVRLSGKFEPLDEHPDRMRAALEARGCSAAFDADDLHIISLAPLWLRVVNDVRQQIYEGFQYAAPGDAGALMAGLLTGDDSALAWESRSAFLSTGTTHITAVSGANFAILVTVASMLAGGIGNRRKWRWIVGLTAAIWSYAVLVGLPPSAVRAALMATLAIIAARFGRIPDFLTLLMVSIVLHLTIRPSDLHTLSFQLSVAATLALILAFSGWKRSRWSWPMSMVLVAGAAHLATVPILVYHLGEISLTSIPANSAITPLVIATFPLVAFAGVTGLLSDSLGSVAATLAAFPASAIVHIVVAFDNHFGGAVVIGQIPTGVILLLALGCWGIIAVASKDVRVLVHYSFRGMLNDP